MKIKPHAGQLEVEQGIAANNPDVIVIDASRGWGKTLWVTTRVVIPYMIGGANRQVMWVAPTYKICKSPIEDVWEGIDEETGERFIPKEDQGTGFQFWEYHKADGEVSIWNGSRLFIRSAQNPDQIVSKGYGLIIIDEAALIPKEVFQQNILPTARRKNCKIVLISTPRGKNWFYHLYLDGQDSTKKRYLSFQQPWWKRPDYPPLLIDLMKDLPQHIREQEFEAKFIDGGSGVLKNFDNVFYGDEIEYDQQDQEWIHPKVKEIVEEQGCVLAVDFAKSVDFSVFIALSYDTKEVIYYKRMRKVDYKTQLDIIKHLSTFLNNCDVFYDGTGVGAGVGDFLNEDINSIPFVFTNQSKNEIINKLIIAFDYGTIKIPNITTIKTECEVFEFNITRTGKISYSAPDGKHDDIVMALAMANYYIEFYGGAAEVREIDNFLSVVNNYNRPKSFLDEMMEEDD